MPQCVSCQTRFAGRPPGRGLHRSECGQLFFVHHVQRWAVRPGRDRRRRGRPDRGRWDPAADRAGVRKQRGLIRDKYPVDGDQTLVCSGAARSTINGRTSDQRTVTRTKRSAPAVLWKRMRILRNSRDWTKRLRRVFPRFFKSPDYKCPRRSFWEFWSDFIIASLCLGAPGASVYSAPRRSVLTG